MSTTATAEVRKLTKEERLQEWLQKAQRYSRKERSKKILPKPMQIYMVDLGENVGSEINGVRPFLVLSSTVYNDNSGTITGIPCSNKEFSKLGQVHITTDILHEGKVRGSLKVEQVTTISKGRIGKYVGRLNYKGGYIVSDKLERFLVPLSKKNLYQNELKYKKIDPSEVLKDEAIKAHDPLVAYGYDEVS